MGSCFAQEMSRLLSRVKFDVYDSPFGISFNPLSLSIQLNAIIDGYIYSAKDLIFDQGLFHSLDHHGQYSHSSSDQMIDVLNRNLLEAKEFLYKANVVIVTFGSAHYYQHIASSKIASNCHKIAPLNFVKKKADTEMITNYWNETLDKIRKFNPKVKFIFSVSPVRYLRDGFIENSRSKATLIDAIGILEVHQKDFYYFPAYELIMDDLRDYRYVKEDMVHPNNMAIEYIWNYFANAYFDANTKMTNERISEIVLMQNHRTLHAESSPAQQTNQVIALKIEKFKQDFPHFKID
ncbi:MAG: GSCFA domain-containing protein [Saprospiraceae bacterium]